MTKPPVRLKGAIRKKPIGFAFPVFAAENWQAILASLNPACQPRRLGFVPPLRFRPNIACSDRPSGTGIAEGR